MTYIVSLGELKQSLSAKQIDNVVKDLEGSFAVVVYDSKAGSVFTALLTGKQVLQIYLKVVESSYFNSSDKVINLADQVEQWFIKHFTGENRRKAMKYQKPHHRKESHSVTFFIGLFTGCFVALLAGYIIMAHLTRMYRKHSDNTFYMETAYPVLSMFGLLFLHLFLYGCNIFMWRKARINYSFIFELGSGNELKYRDVFLICTASMSAIVGVMFVHLSLVAKGPQFLFLDLCAAFLTWLPVI